MQRRDDVEAINKYTSGGYALIEPGMVVGKRYEVVDKLGHGDSATVWLCWLRGTKHPNMRWVAIKVFKAAFSSQPFHEMEKKRLLIRRGGKETEWTAAHVAMPIGEFRHDDVNGSHRCLVMPVLGPSLESRGSAHRPALKEHLYATALALEYLHHHGVSHGQVGPHNVRWLLGFQDANILSTRDMKDRLGLKSRKRRTNTRRPDQPGLLIPSADLTKLAPRGRIVLFPSSTGPTDPAGVPHWYWGPEVLTGLGFLTGIEYRDRAGGDVWSFGCLVLDLYARCTLGAADAGASDAHLWQHVKTLERFLGPFRRPTVFLADERGHFVDRVPAGRMCESEADYARWKRAALGKLPAGTTALEALLGSDRFRASRRAPQPVERDAALPGPEAGGLAAMLASALCYGEGERSIQRVLQSGWFSDLRSRRTKRPMFAEMTPSLAEYHAIKPQDTSAGSTEVNAEPAPAPEPVAEPKTRRPHLQITGDSNPLLELATLDVTRTDVFDLLDITRDIVVPEDEVLVQTPPTRKIQEAKQVLDDARKNKTFATENYRHLLEEHILAVCRAYRDHGERVLSRARALAVRADQNEAYGDEAGYARPIGKMAKLMKEYARYRAERVGFYRRELQGSNTSDRLHREMLSEFPDLRDGELEFEDPPSQNQVDGTTGAKNELDIALAMQKLQILSKMCQKNQLEGDRHRQDVYPTKSFTKDGLVYPDTGDDILATPYSRSPIEVFFGAHKNPDPDEIAAHPAEGN